jgi:hypothetical protein
MTTPIEYFSTTSFKVLKRMSMVFADSREKEQSLNEGLQIVAANCHV